MGATGGSPFQFPSARIPYVTVFLRAHTLADVRFLWGKLVKLEKEKRTTFSNRSLLWFFVSKIGGRMVKSL